MRRISASMRRLPSYLPLLNFTSQILFGFLGSAPEPVWRISVATLSAICRDLDTSDAFQTFCEYGSGGADIERKVAEFLGWICLDKQIIERVAALEKVVPTWAEEADEYASAWWERVTKSFRHGGPESYVGEGPEVGVDHDTLQQFTASVIEEAARESNRVVIAGSSQCILNPHPNVFHVLVSALFQKSCA
jgi:hypothetical protein